MARPRNRVPPRTRMRMGLIVSATPESGLVLSALSSQPRPFRRMLMRVPAYLMTAAADQEVQVGAAAGLLDVLGVQPGPAAGGLRRGRRPPRAAAVEFGVGDLEAKRAGRHVE